MDGPESMADAEATNNAYGALSCLACRRLKRKCSKERPSCSLCSRVGRECEYPTPSSSPDPSSIKLSSTWGPNGLGSPPPSNESYPKRGAATSSTPWRYGITASDGSTPPMRVSRIQRSHFPAAWYLDSVYARGMETNVPCDLCWSDIDGIHVSMNLDDARQIAHHYFSTTHDWFPVVSFMRISRFLDACVALTAADTVALFISMHLISQGTEREHQAETQATMYQPLKVALSACEQHGQLTTNFLAAQVLVCAYEIAHGIYPAAYFTVGACTRTCFTLGVHDRQWATQLDQRIDTWTELEEQRRLWWATLVQDRYMNTGFMFRPLATPHIPPNEIVPADDSNWDKGELSVNPLLVMSIEAKSDVAPFARSCQAAHLLGRVNQHVNEHADPSDVDFHYDEAKRIQRAIIALLAILEQEYHETQPNSRHKLLLAKALCFSGLLELYNVHCCIESTAMAIVGRNKGMRMELQQLAIEGFKRISATVLDFAEEIRQAVALQGLDCISPFVLDALYNAAGTYAWYARENGSEAHLASLNQIREVIKLLEPRWQVAGDYLELLKDTEFQYFGGCNM